MDNGSTLRVQLLIGSVSIYHRYLLYVLYDVIFWVASNFFIGFVLSSIENRRFSRFAPSSSAERLAARAALIKRFTRVDRWKRYLPEAGSFFKGGISKSSLEQTSKSHLAVMMNEFQRARVVHILLILVWPITLAFNPLWITIAMAPYVILANVPCLISLTYSYYRFAALLKRR
ncbi:MAG: hypothetical protein M0019_09665 [Actinomycetota bacterium]|nr:hypothetical protein [Actinomycetota bacterium]